MSTRILHLPEGKKSYAVTFELQDPDKTLSDKVIEKNEKNIRRSPQRARRRAEIIATINHGKSI